MNILILGGNSLGHREWVQDVGSALRDIADEVRIHNYRHWETGEPQADVPYEIKAATATAEGLEDFIVVAKSIGTVIAAQAINQELLTPRACLFMGVPLEVINEDFQQLGDAYAELPPTIFLQNTEDPLGSAEDLNTYLEIHQPVSARLTTVRGDTHDYSNFELIKSLTESLPK